MKLNGRVRGVMGKFPAHWNILSQSFEHSRDANNWNKVDVHTREQLHYQKLADGEFW